MNTNVSTLLREFPRVRRAALSGETVIIKTREGNLRLTRDEPAEKAVLGCMKGQLVATDNDIDRPTSTDEEWKPSL